MAVSRSVSRRRVRCRTALAGARSCLPGLFDGSVNCERLPDLFKIRELRLGAGRPVGFRHRHSCCLHFTVTSTVRVFFIAADLLEGRDTPSRGLDIAALYIAAQFRRAGLEPADDGYFQTAKMLRIAQAAEGFELRMQSGARTLTVSTDQTIVVSQRALELSGAPVYKIANAADLRLAGVKGKVVECARPITQAAAALQPAAFLEAADDDRGRAAPRLIDADKER